MALVTSLEEEKKIYAYQCVNPTLIKANEKFIGRLLHPQYNGNGNRFEINDGHIFFSLADKNFPSHTKLKTKVAAEAMLQEVIIPRFNLGVKGINDKRTITAEKIPDLFDFKYIKKIATEPEISESGILKYWTTVFKLYLDPGAAFKTKEDCLFTNEFIIVGYVENQIISLDYRHLPIIGRKVVKARPFPKTNISKQPRIIYNRLNTNSSFSVFPYFCNLNGNIPACENTLTLPVASNITELKSNSNDIVKIPSNNEKKIFRMISHSEPTQTGPGKVVLTSKIDIYVVSVGEFAFKRHREINEVEINSIFSNIYSKNTLDGKNQGNKIYLKALSDKVPPTLLSVDEKKKIDTFINGQPFTDYVQVETEFNFRVHDNGCDIFEILDKVDNFERKNNYVVVLSIPQNADYFKELRPINGLIPDRNKENFWRKFKSKVHYMVLENFLKNNKEKYYGQDLYVGDSFFKYLSQNPFINELLSKYMVSINKNMEGVNIEDNISKVYNNLNLIARHICNNKFHTMVTIADKFQNNINAYKTGAYYPVGTNLIIFNPFITEEYNKAQVEKTGKQQLQITPTLVHELTHYLAPVTFDHNKMTIEYPDYTLMSNNHVRACEKDIFSIILENWIDNIDFL